MNDSFYSISVFCDLRRSTVWQTSDYESQRMSIVLLQDFDGMINAVFTGGHIRFLGDGFFILFRVYQPDEYADSAKVMIMNRIQDADGKFNALRRDHARLDPKCEALKLGWGAACGIIDSFKLSREWGFTGPSINLARRCCDASRPDGIVLDYDSFLWESDRAKQMGLCESQRQLKDFDGWRRVYCAQSNEG